MDSQLEPSCGHKKAWPEPYSKKQCAPRGRAESIDVAVRAVAYASRISMAVQSTHRDAGTACIEKADLSPVTIADFGVQCLITEYISVLTGVGASIRLVAEEDAGQLQSSSRNHIKDIVALLNDHFPFKDSAYVNASGCRQHFAEDDILELLRRGGDAGGRTGSFWVLDPIDGTKGFIRDSQYAIGLALVDAGMPVVSAMACPNLPASGGDVENRAVDGGFVFVGAASWAGCLQLNTCIEKTISIDGPLGFYWCDVIENLLVGDVRDLQSAVMCQSFAHRGKDDVASRSELLKSVPARYLDSMSKYSLVARGDCHLYVRGGSSGTRRHECIWDHAAGVPIVLGAGGSVTDFHGKTLDFGVGRYLAANDGVLVTNGALHAQVLAEIVKQRVG